MALEDDFRGDGRNKVEVFRENRMAIAQGVRQNYAVGDTGTDGSVLIHSGGPRERLLQMAEQGCENQVSAVVAKLLPRGKVD
jgi:hypothetical protein